MRLELADLRVHFVLLGRLARDDVAVCAESRLDAVDLRPCRVLLICRCEYACALQLDTGLVPFSSLSRALKSFLSSSTRLRPLSMNASNLDENSAMRRRKSSKGISTAGSCVSDESAYEYGARCDRDVRNEDVDVENAEGASAAIVAT